MHTLVEWIKSVSSEILEEMNWNSHQKHVYSTFVYVLFLSKCWFFFSLVSIWFIFANIHLVFLKNKSIIYKYLRFILFKCHIRHIHNVRCDARVIVNKLLDCFSLSSVFVLFCFVWTTFITGSFWFIASLRASNVFISNLRHNFSSTHIYYNNVAPKHFILFVAWLVNECVFVRFSLLMHFRSLFFQGEWRCPIKHLKFLK